MSRFVLGASLLSILAFASPALSGPDDTMQIFVSKELQSLVVYEGDDVVATSNVSTGKPGHTTPSGIFSVLEKRKTHFSSIYDNAPMPFMQRLTWSGIALHESHHVPDYPASHGCVRMPREFAKSLFSMTKRGYHVIITDKPVTPRVVSHANLFSPRMVIPSDLLSDAELRPAAALNAGAELALAEVPPKAGATAVAALPEPAKPVRILITRAPDSVSVADAQAILNRLGYDTGGVTGIVGKKTRAAIRAFQELHGHPVTGEFNPALTTALYKMTGRTPPANGRLFVRRDFKPVFDAPVEIREPAKALGTHFFLAHQVNAAQGTVEWTAATLENPLSERTRTRLGIHSDADHAAPDAATRVLDRLVLTDDLKRRIGDMLGNGSSLTVTDQWSPDETGLGTDFITILNKPRPVPEPG